MGYDLLVSLFLTTVLYGVFGSSIVKFDLPEFVTNATSLSGSLTAVIITGVAILVTLTDSDFLIFLKKNDIFNNLMFTFEYTALLSLFVAFFGIVLQTYDFSFRIFYAFTFSFLYLIFAVSRIISQIISFGDRKGDLAMVRELEKEIDENLDQAPRNNTEVEKADESELQTESTQE